MDGENDGKPYFLMDDLGGKSIIFGNTQIDSDFNFHLLLILVMFHGSSKVPDAPPMALLLAIEGCKRYAAFHLSQLESDL